MVTLVEIGPPAGEGELRVTDRAWLRGRDTAAPGGSDAERVARPPATTPVQQRRLEVDLRAMDLPPPGFAAVCIATAECADRPAGLAHGGVGLCGVLGREADRYDGEIDDEGDAQGAEQPAYALRTRDRSG